MFFHNTFSPFYFSNFHQPFYCFIPVFPCDSSFYFSNFHAARFIPQQPFHVEGSGFSVPPGAINACPSGDLAGTSAFFPSSNSHTSKNLNQTGLSRREEGGNVVLARKSSEHKQFADKNTSTEDIEDTFLHSRSRGSCGLAGKDFAPNNRCKTHLLKHNKMIDKSKFIDFV